MDLKEFLKTSYTPFHATYNCERMLLEAGFKKLSLAEKWKLVRGGKYYITKNESSVIAFVVGKTGDYAFNIAAAHTDSPCLRVKGKKLVDSVQGKRINVEVYGGLINYTIMDIPLKVAGRAMVANNGKLESKLVESACNVNIPSLAVHQNRGVNDGVKFEVQNDLLPLLGQAEDVYSLFDEKNIVDADLFVVPDVEPFVSGAKGEFLCSPRIDNLTSVYSIINAICDCKGTGISVACCFDNEEVGSVTKQGADSSLLRDVLFSINESLGHSQSEFCAACEKGMLLSVDNGHATHPAHPEKSDVADKVLMGGGVVIKHNTNYSTDAYSSAPLKMLLDKKKVKYQDFFCNSNLRSGGTVGLVVSSLLHMNACDIGLAQLAMHSAIETVALRDVEEMTKCCRAFYETNFNCEN